MKVCTLCSEEKVASEFQKNRAAKDGLFNYCRVCNNEKRKKRYWANRGQELRDRAKYREENLELCRKQNRSWLKRNPEKNRQQTANHHSQRRIATPSWANEEIINFFYAHAEFVRDRDEIKMSVDHIVPIQSKFVCGLHVEHNLQIIPMVENQSKGNHHWPEMWT